MRPENTENLRVARIENINGASALTVDGRPIPMMSYQWRLGANIVGNPEYNSRWQIENLKKAGVELYFSQMIINNPDKLDAYYDQFIKQMELLTEIVPDALVMPWIRLSPYAEFAEKYPDEVIHFEDGTTRHWVSQRATGLPTADHPRYTFASRAWEHEIGGQLREFIRRLKKSPYAHHIIGYFFFCFDQEFSYFFEFNGLEHCIDFSPAMQLAFRDHLLEKYHGDVKLLRKAWKDETVTFIDAKIPGLKERTTGDFGYFRDPAKSAQVYDYVECHNKMTADRFEYIAKCCKEETDYKHVVGGFWGYLMNQDIQMGGQTQFKQILNSPYVDFWSSPFTYENRCAGNFASLRAALQSLRRHNKLYFAEVDCFLSDTSKATLDAHCYPNQTKEEDKAMLLRDFVYPFCEGQNGWWIDWCAGPSMFKEDGLQPLMRKIREIGIEGFTLPRGPISDIAAIIDQESLHTPACNSRNHDDNKTMTNAVLFMQHSLDRFRIDELPRLGTPVDFYETDDCIDGENKPYKMYIFLNQYKATDRERALIEKNLKKDGNVLVWMYGAGLINPDAEETLSLENARDLTGFNLTAEMREARCVMTAKASPLCPSIKEGEKIGDYLRERIQRFAEDENYDAKKTSQMVQPFDQFPEPNLVYPLISIEDDNAIPLATFDDNGKVGLAIKQYDNWTSVYVGAPCLQSHVLRDLAHLAGAHLFVDGEEIVYANESYIGIHTNEAGPRTIRLKEAGNVKEVVSGREIGQNIIEFTEDIPWHTTRLYQIKK